MSAANYYEDEEFENPPPPTPRTATTGMLVAAAADDKTPASTHIRQTRLPRPAATTTTTTTTNATHPPARKHHHHRHKHTQPDHDVVPPSPASTLRIYGPEGSEDDLAVSAVRKRRVTKERPPDLPAAKVYNPVRKPSVTLSGIPAAATTTTSRHAAAVNNNGGKKTKQNKKKAAALPQPAAPPPAPPARTLSTVVNPAQMTNNANFEQIAKLVAVIDAQKERIRTLADANKTMKIVKQRQDKALQQMGKQQAAFPNLLKQLTDEIRTLKYDRQRTREALTEKFHESLQKHAENVKLRLALVEARKAELELRMGAQKQQRVGGGGEAKSVAAPGRDRGIREQQRSPPPPRGTRGGRGGAAKNVRNDTSSKHWSNAADVQVSSRAPAAVREKKESSRAPPPRARATKHQQAPVAALPTFAGASKPPSFPPPPVHHRTHDDRSESRISEYHDVSLDEESAPLPPSEPSAPSVHAPQSVSDTASTASEPAYGSDFEDDDDDDTGDDDDDDKQPREPKETADDIIDETPTTPVNHSNTDIDVDDDAYASDFETSAADLVVDAEGNNYDDNYADGDNDNDDIPDMTGFVPTAADRAYLSQLGVSLPSQALPSQERNHLAPVGVQQEITGPTLSASADSAAPSTIHKPNLFARPAPESLSSSAASLSSPSSPQPRQQPQQNVQRNEFKVVTPTDLNPRAAERYEQQQQQQHHIQKHAPQPPQPQHKLDFLAPASFGAAAAKAAGAAGAAATPAYPSWLRGPAEAASL
ncbi:hypothetical protein HDU86_005310 [Geranomyces michiganensis]|nr:hypothetical protein HDU86_005310 [Geranomyces michiganensis]